MSANRRRRRRRMRGIVRTQGAGVKKKAPIKKAPNNKPDERLERYAAAMFRDGQGRSQPHKPQRSKLWTQHTVDQHPAVYGTRNATRRLSSAWGGHWLRMREWERGSFIRGKGLQRSPSAPSCYVLYVQGRKAGYHEDAQYALAWTRAANGHELQATMVQEVQE